MVLLLFYSLTTYSQEFAPVGATWHYSSGGFSSNTYYPVKIQSLKDTVIMGIQCRKTTATENYSFNNGNYVYSSSNKVYLFDSHQQQFVKIYDFNLNAGDTLRFRLNYLDVLDTISGYIIDSTGTTMINGKTLKVQYTHNIMHFNPYPYYIMGGKMIEGIGSDFFLFPQYINQDPLTGQLRCYSDTSIGYYNTGIVSNCDSIVTNVKEDINPDCIQLFPNPASNTITFNIGIYKDFIVTIFNSIGQTVLQKNLITSNTTLNIQSFQQGMYYYQVTNDKGKVISGKFVKE
jgi:hypothetical protein